MQLTERMLHGTVCSSSVLGLLCQLTDITCPW